MWKPGLFHAGLLAACARCLNRDQFVYVAQYERACSRQHDICIDRLSNYHRAVAVVARRPLCMSLAFDHRRQQSGSARCRPGAGLPCARAVPLANALGLALLCPCPSPSRAKPNQSPSRPTILIASAKLAIGASARAEPCAALIWAHSFIGHSFKF